MFFSISCIVLTCYVSFYSICLGFNTLLSCFFAGFLLFSPNGSVTGCDSSLGRFCYSPVYFISRMRLYYDYVVNVVIGVLRPSWFTEILFWIGFLLTEEVRQLKIIIIIIKHCNLLYKSNNFSWNLSSMHLLPEMNVWSQVARTRLAIATSCSLSVRWS